MTTKRLIGRDGNVYTVKRGTVIIGDGTTKLTKGYYAAIDIASESGLPEGLETGYVFRADETIIPKSGDKVLPLQLTKRCDIRNFSIEYSADEIDVTTLCDDTKKYRAGFIDASGSMEGLTTINVSEDLLNKFVPVITQGTTLSDVELKDIDGEALLLKLELNGENAGADILSYFATVALTSYTIGASIDSEQTYTAKFRITPDDVIKPAILKEKTE